jgi:hypothetical protein
MGFLLNEVERTGIEPVTPCLQSHRGRVKPLNPCRSTKVQALRGPALPARRDAGGLGDGEVAGELHDTVLAPGEPLDDAPAGGLGERVEDAVEGGWRSHNHMVI